MAEPASGVLLAEQRLEQRRLAAAVGSDEPDAIAAIDDQVDVADERRGAGVADVELLGLDRLLAARVIADGEAQPDLPGGGELVLMAREPLHLLQLLATRLGLLGLLPGDVAADEVLGARDRRRLPLVGGVEPLVPLLALDDVFVVAARVDDHLAGFHLDDVATDRAQKVAIVRDQHERLGPLAQPLLEVLGGLDVEVVGRLVEEQQIRLLEQHLGQLEAAALAARERVDRALEIGRREAEILRQRLDPDLERVAAFARVALLQLAVALERLLVGEVLLERQELVVDRQQLLERLEQRVEDLAAAGELLRLLQVRDRAAARARDGAPVGREPPVEQAQERRLSRAVGSDEPDAIAGVHLPGQAGEDLGPGIAEVCVGELNQHARVLSQSAHAARGGGSAARAGSGGPAGKQRGALALLVVPPGVGHADGRRQRVRQRQQRRQQQVRHEHAQKEVDQRHRARLFERRRVEPADRAEEEREHARGDQRLLLVAARRQRQRRGLPPT